ncbi:hypothetical protein B484DRAFT_419996 [Ochromonadaceae sp. CCMP2298]|nr:hypothetical protein B484DRAFT_419996 [Ochromonadaceae sp. CCMP2298]
MPPVRTEGIHYLSLGFGLCSGSAGETGIDPVSEVCEKRLFLLVQGGAVQVGAYGHYTSPEAGGSKELDLLQGLLPDWSKGAEWTNFPSMIVTRWG